MESGLLFCMLKFRIKDILLWFVGSGPGKINAGNLQSTFAVLQSASPI